MEDNRKTRYENLKNVDVQQVEAIIRQNPSVYEVCFTSGEPTLNPRLPEFIMAARRLGVPVVSLISNGRMFANPNFTLKVLKAGLNLLNVSIHGHNKRIHDGLTRSPGAFEQLSKGLVNLSRFGRISNLKLRTSTTVNKRNLPYLRELILFLQRFSIEQYVFNAIQPAGRANNHFDKLVPTYTEIVEGYYQMLKSFGERRIPAYLVDIPHCLTEDVPPENRGFFEERFISENQQDCQFELPTPQADKGPVSYWGQGKTKLDTCHQCKYDRVCDGIWKPYLRVYGTDEFKPVRG